MVIKTDRYEAIQLKSDVDMLNIADFYKFLGMDHKEKESGDLTGSIKKFAIFYSNIKTYGGIRYTTPEFSFGKPQLIAVGDYAIKVFHKDSPYNYDFYVMSGKVFENVFKKLQW